MPNDSSATTPDATKTWDWLRRSLREFLRYPLLISLGLLILALLLYGLDRSDPRLLRPLRGFLERWFFSSAQETGDFLSTLTGGLMTVTSISVSMLLVALQQSASNMGNLVFDQFLNRRRNQVYMGIFVAMVLYSLLMLSLHSENFNPVFGATFGLLGGFVSVLLIIVLLYSTIHQMRPEVIIDHIHNSSLNARNQQVSFLRRTLRSPQFSGRVSKIVHLQHSGFVVGIDLETLGNAGRKAAAPYEIVLLFSFGSFIAYGDAIAQIKADRDLDLRVLEDAVTSCLTLENQREMISDPAYGIQQLEMISWTAISTAKSTPETGMLGILALRDLLSRWLVDKSPKEKHDILPVVYQDNVLPQLMDALESLAVVSSESLQHQNYIEVLRTIAVLYGRMPVEMRMRANDMLSRIVSALGDHVLTGQLDATISVLVDTLREAGERQTAYMLEKARTDLGETLGKLKSRDSRAK